MQKVKLGYRAWYKEVPQFWRADLLAGLTLWAMIVPEAVAYANLAGAPSQAAGLYGIIIVLPIYAIFASSRFLVATSTAAVSVTTASFMAVLTGEPQSTFAALVICTAIAYFIFYFFRLGFIADFISEPVSRGFMFGLAAFIVIGQVPKVLGVEKASGNSFEQLWGLLQNLPNINWANTIFGVLIFAFLIVVAKINKKLPAGLIAIAIAMVICYFFNAESRWNMEMVGALPQGLPKLTLPKVGLSDLGVLIPASIGLVILASAESTVLASSLAMEHNQKLDVDQQFFAFGAGNIVGGFFGALIGAGSTSSTMVNHEAGAKTLMSTVWASIVTIFTVLFLTGLFKYLPEVFLGILIIHAVYRLLSFRNILDIRQYSKAEFVLASLAALNVLVFDVLNGLLLAMLLNIIYIFYKASKIKVARLGYLKSNPAIFMPLDMNDEVVKPRDGVLALGLEQGQVYYGTARRAFNQAMQIIREEKGAKTIVVSLGRVGDIDYSVRAIINELQDELRKDGRVLYLTNVRNPEILKELTGEKFEPDLVHVSTHLDLSKI